MALDYRGWVRLVQHSAVRFAAVGLLNTVLSLMIIFSLKWFFAVADVPANLVGYIFGVASSFVLNKRWTFSHQGPFAASLFRFLFVFACAYGVNLTVVLVLIRIVGVNAYLGHVLGMPVYTVVFYLGCRYFAFAEDRNLGSRW